MISGDCKDCYLFSELGYFDDRTEYKGKCDGRLIKNISGCEWKRRKCNTNVYLKN